MARVLLVGEGAPPGPDEAATGFAQLRLAQLRDGLTPDHDVVLATGGDAVAAAAEVHPDLVVSAGTWAPTRGALAAAGALPLCLDLPGDPFADAQAVAAFGDAEAVAEAAAALFAPALCRGDHFLSIGPPSRFALLGQLGLLGRLARTPPGEEWVSVAPIAWSFPGLGEAAPRPAGTRVALVGSFNTWFDGETLLAGLLRAMDRAPVEVDVVGGPVPGHHEATFAAFRAGARASAHAARFRFHPRLPARDLAGLLARCHVGVSLDRPGYEPELGSRTRLLLYLHQGLRVVATARCALARELAGDGFLTEVPPGDAAAVSAAILAPLPLPDRASLRTRYSVSATTAGLRAWASAPRRAPVTGDPDVLAALRRERDALRRELDAVRASPTWRALDGLNRLRRR